VLCAAFSGLCVKQKFFSIHIQGCAPFVPQGLHPLPLFSAADFTQSVQSEKQKDR
jgi:hypothetical protein